MGWWKIDSVENGQIDPDGGNKQSHPELYYNGDKPADILDAALDAIAAEYEEEWGRPPVSRRIAGRV